MKLADKLFINIETYRACEFDQLSQEMQDIFIMKIYDTKRTASIESQYKEKAGLYPEYGRIACISLGYETLNKECESEFRQTTICDNSEIDLLIRLRTVLDKFEECMFTLAGHNVINFDIPYLIKRYIINNLKIPPLLLQLGKKPWELGILDTATTYRFNGMGSTDLMLIAGSLDIEIDTELLSADFHKMEWNDETLDTMCEYSEMQNNASYQIAKRIRSLI